MKAILKNIKPQTCANIMNLVQSILVIKDKREATAIQKLIDEYEFAEFYVYCTKGKRNNEDLAYCTDTNKWKLWYSSLVKLNGKVIFKFRCYKVEKILNYGLARRSEIMMEDLLKKSCLTMKELNEYAPHKEYDDNDYIYAIHISDLEIFDEPKEVCEFYKANEQMEYIQSLWNGGGLPDKDDYDEVILTKAPKNFCYVEIE